jgi:hypothetical protein
MWQMQGLYALYALSLLLSAQRLKVHALHHHYASGRSESKLCKN